MSDLAKIRKRHADIPQDTLPGLEVVEAPTGPGAVKRRSPKSAGYAVCPHHLFDETARNEGMTGLVRDADGELVFREHAKRVGALTIRCPGSGTAPSPLSENAGRNDR